MSTTIAIVTTQPGEKNCDVLGGTFGVRKVRFGGGMWFFGPHPPSPLPHWGRGSLQANTMSRNTILGLCVHRGHQPGANCFFLKKICHKFRPRRHNIYEGIVPPLSRTGGRYVQRFHIARQIAGHSMRVLRASKHHNPLWTQLGLW